MTYTQTHDRGGVVRLAFKQTSQWKTDFLFRVMLDIGKVGVFHFPLAHSHGKTMKVFYFLPTNWTARCVQLGEAFSLVESCMSIYS